MESANSDRQHFPRRPPRLSKVFQNMSPFYFITFNTHLRQPFLATEAVHRVFREFGQKAGDHGIAVGRYVIMPDHVHLFVRLPPEGMRLQRWVQALKSVLGKTLIAQGHEKPHWQEGFFDHLMRTGESYSQKWEYVRQNPVRKGLATTPESWPYQGEIVPIRW